MSCFGSFMFTWSVVTKYLFRVFFFVFVLFFVFSFSAKTTVQWYFIVGPLLAVTVLAFIVLYLWKRRSAGIHTTSDKYICILSTRSQWKTPNIYYSDYKKPHNYILVTSPISKGEIRVLHFDIEDHFAIPSKFMKINMINCNQEI